MAGKITAARSPRGSGLFLTLKAGSRLFGGRRKVGGELEKKAAGFIFEFHFPS